MKKYFCFALIAIFIILLFATLNINVFIQQCINYRCQSIRIPLYLKILDFYDRHYNYKWLTSRIIEGTHSDTERAIKLFNWTYNNIRKAPQGYPIMDDHVWHIIIRGYGVTDQSSDVFTTLCNYAGIDAFFTIVGTRRFPLSFVKLKSKWHIFDPYHGIYFKDEKGDIADIDTLRSTNWNIESLKEKPGLDYAELFQSLPSIKKIGLIRANIQSPLNRLLYEINKLLKNRQEKINITN